MTASKFLPLWLKMVVACSLLLASAHACTGMYDACPCNQASGKQGTCGSGPHPRFDYNGVTSNCNVFGCDCDRCEPACSRCIELYGTRFGGALPTNNSTNSTDPCADFKSFDALSVKELMATLNSAFCKSGDESVGFRFLAHVLNQVDTNKDGVIDCKEYNADQARDLSVIKRKPECKLQDGIKLTHAN